MGSSSALDEFMLDELIDRGADVSAPEDVVRLYRQAFAGLGPRALWSSHGGLPRC
jgi:hypothetical protein